jgi:hypothetical protein
MEIIIDDMEHQVRKVIAEHRNDNGFPQLEAYGVSEEEFDDYLFDKQAVIDNVDSLRKKYTIYSIIFIIPFVVIAFYETTVRNTLIATGCGLVLCMLYYLLTILVRKIRMSRMNNEAIERYITDVMKFQDR